MPTDPRPRTAAVRRWVVLALLWACASWAIVAAQALPNETTNTLQRGQALAAQAQVTYVQHFPDQPLWAAAIAAGREAAEAAPESPAPQRFLAQVYGRTSWHARAWEAWQAYLALGGELDASAANQLLETALWLGVNAYDQGWSEQAQRYLEAVVEIDPGEARAHERLARLALARVEPLAALPHLVALGDALPRDLRPALATARSVERFGAAAVAAYDAGRAAAARSAWTEALAHYRAAASAASDFVDAWRGVGMAALAVGRPAEAEEALARVLVLEPGDSAARAALETARAQRTFGVEAQRAFARGVAEYDAGSQIGARLAFEAAIDLNPRYIDALAWLGRIAAETGDLTTAASRYGRALALAPTRSDLVRALAAVEVRQADASAASAAATSSAAQAAAQAAAAARAEAAAQAAAQAEAQAQAAAQTEAQAAAQAEAQAQAAAQAEAAAQAQAAAQAEAPTAAETPAPVTVEAAVAVATPPTDASSVLLLDTELVHRASTAGGSSAFTFVRTPHLLRDLARFGGGTLHLRVDVRTKPSDDPVRYQICLVPEDIQVVPACTAPGALEFTTDGTFDLAAGIATLSGADALDWRRGIGQVMLVLRQPDGSPIDDRLLPGQTTRAALDPDRYYPMDVHVSAVLVESGGAFQGWP